MTRHMDESVCDVALLAGPVALGGHTPGGLTDAALGLASPSPVWMIHGVHGHTTDLQSIT